MASQALGVCALEHARMNRHKKSFSDFNTGRTRYLASQRQAMTLPAILIVILSIVVFGLLLAVLLVKPKSPESVSQDQQAASVSNTPAPQTKPDPNSKSPKSAATKVSVPSTTPTPAANTPTSKQSATPPENMAEPRTASSKPTPEPSAKPASPPSVAVVKPGFLPGRLAADQLPPIPAYLTQLLPPLPASAEQLPYLLSRTYPQLPPSFVYDIIHFDNPREGRHYQHAGAWSGRLSEINRKMQEAQKTGDFSRLAEHLARIRMLRVNVSWLLLDNYSAIFKERTSEEFRMKNNAYVQRNWQTYLDAWGKLTQQYQAEMTKAGVTPLHTVDDLQLMDLNKSFTEPLDVSKLDKELFETGKWLRLFRQGFPSRAALGAYLNAELQIRRFTNPQHLVHLRDMACLLQSPEVAAQQMRYDPRHQRLVTGLRVGIAHSYPQLMQKPQTELYQTLPQPLGPKQGTAVRSNSSVGKNLGRRLGAPYNYLAQELRLRTWAKQFGPAYDDLNLWDHSHTALLNLDIPIPKEALATMCREHWDYAILLAQVPNDPLRIQARLIDVVTLEEHGSTIFSAERGGWEANLESWTPALLDLLIPLDRLAVLQSAEMATAKTFAQRVASLPLTIQRESLTALLNEFRYYELVLKLPAYAALEKLQDQKPGLKDALVALKSGQEEALLNQIVELHEQTIGKPLCIWFREEH